MLNNKGFTIVQTVVTVAVVGVLAAIAVYSYQVRVAKAQTSEAMSVIEAIKPQVLHSLGKFNNCTIDGKNTTTTYKYGTLVVSGTVNADALRHPQTLLSTGCKLKYTFGVNSTKMLQGKVIEVDLFNNAVISKTKNTTIPSVVIPRPLTELTADAVPKVSVVAGDPSVAKDTDKIVESSTNGGTTVETPSGNVDEKPNSGNGGGTVVETPVVPPVVETPVVPPVVETPVTPSVPKLSASDTYRYGCISTNYGTTVCMLEVFNSKASPFTLIEGGSGGYLGVSSGTLPLLDWIGQHMECSVLKAKITAGKALPSNDIIPAIRTCLVEFNEPVPDHYAFKGI